MKTDNYPFAGREPLYEGKFHGVRWCIYQAPLNGVLNGYARIPDGVSIDIDTLKVHGGITYGDGTGWVGFDTAHAGDVWDLTELRERVGIHISPAGVAWRDVWAGYPRSRHWTVAELQGELERLCEQIYDNSANTEISDHL